MHVEAVLHWHEKGRSVGWLQRIAFAAAQLWNLRIAVVNAAVLVGEGERNVWLKLESRHYEFSASDNSEEFKTARRAQFKEIAEMFKVAFSKMDCVKDDCMSGGLPPVVAGRLKIFPVPDPCLVRVCDQTRGQG